METALPVLLNLAALFIAVFGIYQSAARDYEKQRDELRETQRRLEACERECMRLREEIFRQWCEREKPASGINISGGSVSIGRDAVGGDEAKHDDVHADDDVNLRKKEE
jgi:hypothetical protein